MSKVSKFSVVRQDEDKFEGLNSIFKGEAEQLTPRFPGDIILKFEESDKFYKVTFDWISSVLYSDELITSNNTFPIKETDKTWGLYEVSKSKYLERIQDNWLAGKSFNKHHHFVYYDSEFLWHITCKGLTISEFI